MQEITIKQVLDQLKAGCYYPMEYERPIQLKKGFEHLKVTKQTKTIVRLKLNYSHLEEIKIKQTEPGSLSKNSEWVKDYENALIYNSNTKQTSLRVTKTRSPKHKTITKWFLNGVEVAKQTLIDLGCLYSKDVNSSSNDSPVFNVNIKDITRLGNFS